MKLSDFVFLPKDDGIYSSQLKLLGKGGSFQSDLKLNY